MASPPPPPPPPFVDPTSRSPATRTSSNVARVIAEYTAATGQSAAAQVDPSARPRLNRPSPISHRPTAMARAAADANRLAEAQRFFGPAGRLGFSPVPVAAVAWPSSQPLGPPSGFPPRPTFRLSSMADASSSAPATSSPPPPPAPAPPADLCPAVVWSSKGKELELGWEKLLSNTVEPTGALQDSIPHNEHVVVPVVPGLEEVITEKEEKKSKGKREVGWKPRLGRVSMAGLRRRFFVEVSVREMNVVVIPAALTPLLVDKFKLQAHKNRRAKTGLTTPKLCVPVRITKCCEYMVQIRWFAGHLVLFKGWDDMVREMKLEYQDHLVVKYDGDGFKLKVFRFLTSTAEKFVCPEHDK